MFALCLLIEKKVMTYTYSDPMVTYSHPKGTSKYDAIKRYQPLVWGNMTHDNASVETGVGGQAKYDVMMVSFKYYVYHF